MKLAVFSPADFFERTEGWPADERGLYLMILLKMHARSGGLPDCDAENARMFGFKDVRTLKAIKSRLLARGPDVIAVIDGLIVNPRALREIAEAKARRSASVEHGKKGGRPSSCTGEANPIPDRSPSDLNPISGRSSIDLTCNDVKNQCVGETLHLHTTPTPIDTPPTPGDRECGADAPKRVRRVDDLRLEALEAFKQFADLALRVGLPVPATLTPQRDKAIRARLREHGPDSWGLALAAVEASDFLLGRTEAIFRLSLDWLAGPKNYPKVLEGNYARKAPSACTGPAKPWWDDTEKLAAVTSDQWRGSIAKHANGIWPIDKLGPPPGHRDCRVPAALIAELDLAAKYDPSTGFARGAWAIEHKRCHAAEVPL